MAIEILENLNNNILSADNFGELVETIYYSKAGSEEIECKAHVFRGDSDIDRIKGTTTQRADVEIFISREYVDYATTRTDKVRYKKDLGSDDYITKTVMKINDVDEKSYYLTIS